MNILEMSIWYPNYQNGHFGHWYPNYKNEHFGHWCSNYKNEHFGHCVSTVQYAKMESAYTFTEYRYRFLKESKETFKAGYRCPGFVKIKTSCGEEYNRVEGNFLEDIRKEVLNTKTHIKDIILKCASTSYEVYREEMKRLSREILELQNWLWKVKEAERKEQIILEKNEKIRKVSQDVESMRNELQKVKSSTKNYGKRNSVNWKKKYH
ncbi:hypothetical protein RhiirA4_489781 [Rhizophagus irregularis]|nr:hypothetical protein RhiirA4_489781 [Rhizophagus irregularis]